MQIVGGVRQAAAQWRRVEFSPEFIGESGGTTVPTPQGPIISAWQRTGATVEVELALPRGVTAQVRLPGLAPVKATGRHRWTVTPPA
jgi:hypothetical protein